MSIYCNIQKAFGDFQLHIEFQGENEVLSLLGASGSGKSMILRCIAGIEKPDLGQIIVDNRVLFDSQKHINLSPQERHVGLLFQDYALFPNMTVSENIAIVMDHHYRHTLEQTLENYHLTEKQHLYPHQLSGGEKQRCAIARMIVANPDIILLDEPFSSLDSFIKYKLEKELFDTLKNYPKTVILVSHNRDEVYRLSDKISIVTNGSNLPMTEKHELFSNPRNYHSALLTGCKNIYPATRNEGLIRIPDLNIAFKPDNTKHIDTDFQFIGMHANDFFYVNETDITTEDIITFSFHIIDTNEGLYNYYLTVQPEGATEHLIVELAKSKLVDLASSTRLLGIPKSKILHLL
ncbi:MAG: ATP-binding cassette domain-containing protein [Eubacteriales bacterium]